MLRDAGSPVRTAQLVIKCQVPKKKLNQVLHQMKKESRGGLTLVGPATWCLGDAGTDGTREVVLAEQGNLLSRGGGGEGWGPARAVLAVAQPGWGLGSNTGFQHRLCPRRRSISPPCVLVSFSGQRR